MLLAPSSSWAAPGVRADGVQSRQGSESRRPTTFGDRSECRRSSVRPDRASLGEPLLTSELMQWTRPINWMLKPQLDGYERSVRERVIWILHE
jgi:hypothetical protein